MKRQDNRLKWLILSILILGCVAVTYYIVTLKVYDKTNTLYRFLQKNCTTQCEIALSEVFDEDIDYLILLNMYHHDMSKKCGNIRINPVIRQHLGRHVNCGYSLSVKDKKVTSFVKLKCMSELKPSYLDFTRPTDHLSAGYQTLDTASVKVSYDIIEDTPYYFLTATDIIAKNTFDCTGSI